MINNMKEIMDNSALFVAELNGYKSGTEEDKIEYGYQCWKTSKLHELDVKQESDRDDLHENIWLQRLYSEMDNVFQVNSFSKKKLSIKELTSTPVSSYDFETPLELDASASILQWMGVLLDDLSLTEMTNVTGDTLSDPWEFDGIPRKQFKKAATPMLYGSSKACYELWKKNKIKYTKEQVQLFNKELESGSLGLVNRFKDFIIDNCDPKEKMTVKIFNETIDIECNRFKNIGEKTTKYSIYDTITDRIRTISHTSTKKVPDLEQFRRYFVTLLIHNLDSQAANYVAEKIYDKYGFVIPIHDAFIVSPIAANDTRKYYAEFMELVYANRDR